MSRYLLLIKGTILKYLLIIGSVTMKVVYDISYDILVLANEESSKIDRLISFLKVLFASAPIVFVINLIAGWFKGNQEFSTYVIACILLNMIFGIIRHYKRFSWLYLLRKTGLMFLVLVVVYGGLEMMLKIAKDNIITETFRIALQVSTLMYPLSKVFKNVFILTNGEYPPEWVMKRFYKFNQDGDLTDLFGKGTENKNSENLNES